MLQWSAHFIRILQIKKSSDLTHPSQFEFVTVFKMVYWLCSSGKSCIVQIIWPRCHWFTVSSRLGLFIVCVYNCFFEFLWINISHLTWLHPKTMLQQMNTLCNWDKTNEASYVNFSVISVICLAYFGKSSILSPRIVQYIYVW